MSSSLNTSNLSARTNFAVLKSNLGVASVLGACGKTNTAASSALCASDKLPTVRRATENRVDNLVDAFMFEE